MLAHHGLGGAATSIDSTSRSRPYISNANAACRNGGGPRHHSGISPRPWINTSTLSSIFSEPSSTLSTIVNMQLPITLFALMASMAAASPVQPGRAPVLEPRAAATKKVYKYVAYTTLPVASPTAVASCSGYVESADGCPSGCTAAPAAGMLGIVTTKYFCAAPPPTPSWSSWMATSTCGPDSAVTTYSSIWGSDKTAVGCHAMD
ncbi:hypothetical protein AC578_1796 [Pseudocercospora eumusae]|uniref:Uncharacterized protein n=1 Tax=Pseudocercospora eumusae TaxID=321146 RepID=A0A139GWL7_9PEZI|nr:hypothetical protein AC578_1796 [Pseudocercospora eumusae]